jgi:RNA polymerase sigma-B factor
VEQSSHVAPTRSVPAQGADIDDEVERLAEQLSEADPPARAEILDEMVLRAVPLADAIARRYRGRGIDADDLVQVARLAAVKAVRRYRPGVGPGFTAYAVPTIYGEIKRFFRDQGWTLRPPRRLQELRVRIQAEEEVLRHTLMREPTDVELAEAMGCPVEELQEARACSAGYNAVSLDMTTPTGKTLAEQVVGAPCPSDDIVVRDALRRSVAKLDERQRLVVSLRFAEELTQSQIAERIGVSQMQVSRMLSRIMELLRRQLEDRRVDWRRTG